MSTTFFDNSGLVTTVGNSWIGLVTSANVLIDPATSTLQSNGMQKTQLVNTLGTSVTLTGTAMDVNVVGGSISIGSVSVGVTDKSAFTYGTSAQLTIGGVYQDTSPTLTAGTSGAARVTSQRALHMNLRDSSGTEIATAGAPLRVDPTGTTPQPASQSGSWTQDIIKVGGSSISLGLKTSANSFPVVIASDQVAIPVTISGDLVTLSENIAQWGGVATSLGQKAMTASVPVVLASDQTVIPVSQSGTWNINNVSGTISLPTGAATQTTLAAVDTKLGQFTFASTRLLVDGSGVTQPISVASLPLPTGASTSALQTTGNTSLSSIDGKLNSLGQKTMAASAPVVLASNQSAIPVTDNSGSLTVDATSLDIRPLVSTDVVTARLNDGSGNAITSTTGALNVNISGGSVTADLTGDLADLDSGAGTDNHEVIAIGLPGAGGHVVGGTSTNPFRVDPTGTTTQPISAASLPLPTGASTEATLLAAKVDLDKFTFASTRLLVDGSGVTQPISAASLPLPTGAATSALQTAGNSSLSSIDGKIPSLGQAAMAASTPVVIASNQSAVPVSGTVTVAQATGTNLHAVIDSGTVTANIGTTNGLALDATLTGGTQKTKLIDSAGTNVATVTSAGAVKTDASATTQPISAASLPLPTGASTETTLSAVNTLLTARLPGTLGQKTMANSLAVVLASDQSTLPISIASSSVTLSDNIAQWGGVATSLGQKAMTASVPVVLASDQTVIPVSQSGTWNINNISGTVSLPTGASTETTLSAVNTKLGQFTFTTSRLNVDGSGVTQPISAAALPLPTGAATSAKQPALGVAGTASADVITVQGITGMTALKVDGSAVTQPISAASLPLPTGASTEATLLAAKVDLDKFTFASTRLLVDGSGVTQPVSGTVTANAGTGTFTVGQATGTNLHTVVDSGTVTANIGTTNGLALDTSVAGLSLAQASTTSGQKGVLEMGAVTTAAPTYTTAQTSPLSLTTAGALRTDGSGVTQPVSGTVTANQGGTWNITNISGTVSLPTGAATSALQTTGNSSLSSIDGKTPSLGQATMAASVPVTIASNQSAVPVSGTITANIGTSGSLALDATLAKLTITQGATLGSNTVAMMGASVTTAAPTYTTGQISPLSLDTSGNLRTTSTLSGNVTVVQATGTNLHTVVDSGTITANAGTGSFTVAQATGTNLHAVIDSGTVTANAGTGSFTVAQATASNLNANVSGTVTANIGTSGSLALDTSVNKLNISQATALGSNTGPMMQGSVTTSAPSYTTGNINPLSLTTAGSLRVSDPSLALAQASTTSGQTGPLIQGAVTTSAPAYTTAQTSPLSLTTGGALRTSDTNTVAQASTTSGQNGGLIQGAVTTAAPSYTTGQTNPLSLTTAGALRVESAAPDKASYSASFTSLAAAATPTDVFTITGSATKTIKITRAILTGTQTTGNTQDILLIKRSTANSAGTSTTATAVPNDSNNAAATATVRGYTANPTLGTAVGTMRALKLFIAAALPANGNSPFATPDLINVDDPAQPIVLRGTSQVLAVNLNSTTVTGNSFSFFIEWTEE